MLLDQNGTPYYKYNGKNGESKWEYTDCFREPALRFLKDKAYTMYPKGTSGYIEHWNNEKYKIKNGVIIDGQEIDGLHYQYLNYSPIPILGSKNKIDFPNFWDLDADWFKQIRRARELKKFLAALKARKRGFSLKDMLPIVNSLVFENGEINYLVSYKDSYATKSWSFVKRYLNHLNKETGWVRSRNPDGQDHIKMAYLDKNKNEKGRMNELYKAILKDDPTKSVGGNINNFIYEEAGIVPGEQLLDTLEFVKAAMEEGDELNGFIIIYGSVGELDKCQSLKKIFLEPGVNGFMEYDNVWDDEVIGNNKCGYFVPEYLCYKGCIDKDGNSDIEAALDSIARKRKEKKKLSTKQYTIYITQHPIKPSEAFLGTGKNRFPIDLLSKHKLHLEATGEYKYGYGVKLYEINGVIKAEILHEASHPFDEYPVDISKQEGSEGVIWIYEPPMTNNKVENLYIQSTDSIDQDKAVTSDSLFTTYVFKNDPGIINLNNDNSMVKHYFKDEIVASFVGRRDVVDECYNNSMYLTMMYPGCKNFIENSNIGIKTHHLAQGKDFLLQDKMDEVQGINPTSKVQRDKGYHPTREVNAHKIDLAVKYCLEPIGYEFNEDGTIKKEILGLTRLRDRGLIQEMIEHDGEKNTDRLIAFGGLLLFKQALSKREIKVQTSKNDPIAQAAKFADRQLKSVQRNKYTWNQMMGLGQNKQFRHN